jgi:hypothetical protein
MIALKKKQKNTIRINSVKLRVKYYKKTLTDSIYTSADYALILGEKIN